MNCPSCGSELEVVVAAEGVAATSEDAAVEIARINAKRDIDLARMAVASSATETNALQEVATEAIASDIVIADTEAEVALEQPALIGEAIADVVEAVEPATTVIGNGDVTSGDEIVPLQDAVPPAEDESEEDAPAKQHWMTKNF